MYIKEYKRTKLSGLVEINRWRMKMHMKREMMLMFSTSTEPLPPPLPPSYVPSLPQPLVSLHLIYLQKNKRRQSEAETRWGTRCESVILNTSNNSVSHHHHLRHDLFHRPLVTPET